MAKKNLKKSPGKNNDKGKLRRKNIAIGLIIFTLCVVFYFVTIVRLGGAG